MPKPTPFTECAVDCDDVLLHVTRDGGPAAFWLSQTDTLTDAELAAQTHSNQLVARGLIAFDLSWTRHATGWARPDRGTQ